VIGQRPSGIRADLLYGGCAFSTIWSWARRPDLGRSAEGAFGIDDPFFAPQLSKQRTEAERLIEFGQLAVKSELGLLKSVLQGSEKQPAKEARKDFDRQEKLLPACDPACAVRRKAAAWHDAVQMGMMCEGLSPGVKDGDHSDLCAEMAWIGGNCAERIPGGAKKQIIDDPLILQRERGEFIGEREDEVKIRRRQQVGLLFRDPGGLCRSLAFRTVAVAAGVVSDHFFPTLITLLPMRPKRRSPAMLNSGERPPLLA